MGRSQRWLLPFSIIFILVAGLAVTFVVPESEETIGFLGLLLGLGTAATLYIRRSRHLEPKEKRAWRFIGYALTSMWSGIFVVGGLSAAGREMPAFGPFDVFFLLGYALLIYGLYLLMRLDTGGQEWVLTLVDALVGSIAVAALVWNFVAHELVQQMADAQWWQAAIAITYPIADVTIIVALLILVLRRSNYRLDLRLTFLAFGAGAQVMADFLFIGSGLGKDLASADPIWPLNILATIFLILGASIVDWLPKKQEFPEAPTPIWALMWPYLFAGLLLAVHSQTYRQLDSGPDEVLLLDAVIAILVVILVRQVYVIYRDRNKVDRKRAELVASVSHELRTPLTAMVGFLTLLDDHADEFPADAQQEMISEAATQARHMSRLVSDLLMLAKGDMSQLSLEIEEVRATSVITSVLRSVDSGDARIDQELDAEVIVRVDPDRMKQALGNLMTNALRYGGDHCLVVAQVDGRDLIVEIHDNGRGVPTRYEAMIWEHFERGAHRLDSTTPGLGIGLSIVKAVAESHGGRADYRTSERLGGACFALTIPGCVVVDEPARAKIPANS